MALTEQALNIRVYIVILVVSTDWATTRADCDGQKLKIIMN